MTDVQRAVRLSETADDLVEDLCNAYARLVTATEAEEKADAYADLQQRRFDLKEYLGNLELTRRIPRVTRFVHFPTGA